MTERLVEIYKRNIEKRTGLKLEILPANPNYEVGKTYYSGYWCEWFKVLEYKELPDSWMRWTVKCLWEDGRITIHCTPLNLSKDDYLVIE